MLAGDDERGGPDGMQPVAEVVEIAHRHGIPVHTDAVQADGRLTATFSVPATVVEATRFHVGPAPAPHVTVPSEAMTRMAEPVEQEPVTRLCTAAVSTASETLPVVPPPVSPLPAVTAVMSPPESASKPSTKPEGTPLSLVQSTGFVGVLMVPAVCNSDSVK